MALVVMNSGEEEMLNRILNVNATGDVELHLYDETLTINEDTTLAGLEAIECDQAGYALEALAGATWNVTSGGGDPTEADYAEREFIFNAASGNDVYGYYVTNAGNTILLWAEEFTDGPYTIPVGGGSVFVTPKIQLA